MIVKSVDFTRTQKSRYLKKETLLFLQIIFFLIIHINGYFIARNSFVAYMTFKDFFRYLMARFCYLKYLFFLSFSFSTQDSRFLIFPVSFFENSPKLIKDLPPFAKKKKEKKRKEKKCQERKLCYRHKNIYFK